VEPAVTALAHNVRVTSTAYRGPTGATVKSLYAHAFRCAKPECTKPLYTQNNETGDRILNSRVAHIHARNPGGPRWIEMSEDENRAEANLLLLCIEHSYEIDEHPDSYPADLLREWKQSQLDEYVQVQLGWPVNDEEVGRVLEASSQVVEHHQAGAILDVVRRAQQLVLGSRRARRGPASRAADWRNARARARSSFTAWDENGDPVYAEPSRLETKQHVIALDAALTVASEEVSLLADAVGIELAALGAIRPAIRPWCDWVLRAAEEVLAASARWPGLPEWEEDDRLDESLSGLTTATDALTAAWRDESTAPPPPPPPSEPEPGPEAHDPLQDHRALLERARPYKRVDHRPYDAGLRADLAVAAEQAASIPPVLSAYAIGVETTCELAAAVAANADDETLAALIEQDAGRRPLSAAVLLLTETARYAEKRGRSTPQALANAALDKLWNSIDWADPRSWGDHDKSMPRVLWIGSRLTSPESVKERLSRALERRPTIVLPLIESCASWVDVHDSHDFSPLGHRRRYRELPPWFPAEAAAAAIMSVAPNAASVIVDAFGDTANDDVKSLAAQVLRLATPNEP